MKFESFHNSYERVFGKKRFGRGGISFKGTGTITPAANKPKSRRRKKKELCLHCATENFVKETDYSGTCLKCGYEGCGLTN